MEIKKSIKRAAMAIAAAGLFGGLAVATAAPASASTIQNGWLQLCAQGNYSAYVHVLSVPLGNGDTTPSYMSTLVSPGHCWWSHVETDNHWAQVDVVGIYNVSQQEFYIGSKWYNGESSGMGIGAEGSSTSPYIVTW